MADHKMLDRAFQTIMRQMVETGQAPHYTELAKQLGLSVEDGRQVLHDLIAFHGEQADFGFEHEATFFGTSP